MDRDNDGSTLDDVLKFGTQTAGTLMSVGGTVGSIVAPAFGPLAPAISGLAAGEKMYGDLLYKYGGDVAEEVGDFVTDVGGLRHAKPRPAESTTDPHYQGGRTDGLGQQVNRWLTKNGPRNPGEWVGPIGLGPTRGW